MLPLPVEEAIQAIAQDRTSGASRVARQALDTLGKLLEATPGAPDRADVREAANRIAAAQPAMAIVHNVVHLFARLVEEGQDPAGVLATLRAELDSAKDRIARTFLKIAPDAAEVVTTSFSDNVLACLRLAHERGRIARVYVMESRPLFEGRLLAGALSEGGIPAALLPDALAPSLMARASYALVGADSVLRDGSVVNKIGTYPLALAAGDHRKAVYVACESLKFDTRYDAGTWPGAAPRNPEEVWDRPPHRVDVMNRYFEITPGRLVAGVVTERGTYAPDVIKTMLAQAKGEK